MPLLEVMNLKTYFFLRRGVVKAVDGVSFTVDEGEILGLVGESGCGKSVTALSILRLAPKPAGKIVGGQVFFNGVNLLSLSEEEMRKYRGRHLSMILQDPMASLNPVFSIGDQVGEGIALHQGLRGRMLWEKAAEMLRLVRIPSPATRLRDYPHQFSGGMRQRVVGAISLSCQPHLLIADEPTTSLDVTIQSQYLRLIKEIQEEQNLAIIFITHDFGIVAKMCTKVGVMYAGKIVEMAEVRELFNNPSHPYTRALIASVPKVEEKVEMLFSVAGQPPSLLNLPPGCAFLPRCTEKKDVCTANEYPPEITVGRNHTVRCWKYA
ncbi:ABC transporter ATP-binding protein [Chloroflexota bacterium]